MSGRISSRESRRRLMGAVTSCGELSLLGWGGRSLFTEDSARDKLVPISIVALASDYENEYIVLLRFTTAETDVSLCNRRSDIKDSYISCVSL